MDAKTKYVVEKLQTEIVRLEHEVKTFANLVAKNPSYYLCRGDSAFFNAGRLHVYGCLLECLTRPDTKATLESLRKYAQEEALSGIKYEGGQSTSVCGDLMKRQITTAWADACDAFGVLSTL
jgi:hypothetical protein